MSQSEDFLEALRGPTCAIVDAGHLAVITAHPDDETIGCGAQLPRLSGVTIVTVTDGAPRDLIDARAGRNHDPDDGYFHSWRSGCPLPSAELGLDRRCGLELGPVPCILRA
jgi:hypothetical protein